MYACKSKWIFGTYDACEINQESEDKNKLQYA